MTYSIVALFGASEGVDDVNIVQVNAYGKDGHIFLTGAEGREVYVFDINCRMLHHGTALNATETYNVPASGFNIVKVVGSETRRVVSPR